MLENVNFRFVRIQNKIDRGNKQNKKTNRITGGLSEKDYKLCLNYLKTQ